MHMVSERENYVQLLEFSPAMRHRVEAAIVGLINLLDAMDALGEDLEGDGPELDGADDEDGGDDEPSLGAPENIGICASQSSWARGGRSDREMDEADLEDGHDAEEEVLEPELGACENHDGHPDQQRWASGGYEIEDGYSQDRRLLSRVLADRAGRLALAARAVALKARTITPRRTPDGETARV